MNHNAAHFGPKIELINELWSQANLLSFYCFHKLGQKRRKLKKLPKIVKIVMASPLYLMFQVRPSQASKQRCD